MPRMHKKVPGQHCIRDQDCMKHWNGIIMMSFFVG